MDWRCIIHYNDSFSHDTEKVATCTSEVWGSATSSSALTGRIFSSAICLVNSLIIICSSVKNNPLSFLLLFTCHCYWVLILSEKEGVLKEVANNEDGYKAYCKNRWYMGCKWDSMHCPWWWFQGDEEGDRGGGGSWTGMGVSSILGVIIISTSESSEIFSVLLKKIFNTGIYPRIGTLDILSTSRFRRSPPIVMVSLFLTTTVVVTERLFIKGRRYCRPRWRWTYCRDRNPWRKWKTREVATPK